MARRAGTSHGFQIDRELTLFEVPLPTVISHFGDQGASGIGEFLASVSVSKGAVTHCLRRFQPGVGLTALCQL